MDIELRFSQQAGRDSHWHQEGSRPLNKLERIRMVRALGLNTEDDVLIRNEEDWQRHWEWLDQHERFTVRSFREPAQRGGTEPYFAVIDRDEFEPHRKRLLLEGWQLIIAEPVDPVDALMAGTILREGDITEVEIVRGSGSVTRQVTHDGRIDARISVTNLDPSGDVLVDEALNKIRLTEEAWPQFDVLRNVIYEFSYYQPRVGYKREHAIFWEITGYERMDPGLPRKLLGHPV